MSTKKPAQNEQAEIHVWQIIRPEQFPDVPPRTEYSLTDFGRTLLPHVEALINWGRDNFDSICLRMTHPQICHAETDTNHFMLNKEIMTENRLVKGATGNYMVADMKLSELDTTQIDWLVFPGADG